jgi:hypothetical protein
MKAIISALVLVSAAAFATEPATTHTATTAPAAATATATAPAAHEAVAAPAAHEAAAKTEAKATVDCKDKKNAKNPECKTKKH